MRRAGRIVLGVALLWGALGVLGYRLGWQQHAAHARAALMRYAPIPNPIRGSASTCDSQPATPGSDGVLTGVLTIPKLGVKAPVESGTTDQVLNDAVGHFDGTAWPGQHGTSVLLAHDVSYFGHLGSLDPGDQVSYQSGCTTYTFTVTGHQVVKNGAPIPSVPGTAVVLDTCWPTDALWYTPDRYLVEGVQSQVSVGNPAATTAQPSFPTNFTGTASAALQATGLTLETNEEPMGTMSFQGTPSTEWSQSPAPLALEEAALADYFGGYHAATSNNPAWWASVAPGVPMPAPLAGARPGLSSASALNVTITAAGSQPTAVLLHTVLPLYGGSSPGTYAVDVTEAVHGTTVSITKWEVSRV
ncbi:MAG TPA: class D sortase [Acidimicrobiales bacterium]|nr:class D sortase [Acidimicrobiales bacterium]